MIIDPHMNFADAFKRRDLTINAMGIDLKTFELIDPWHGLEDLKKGILRAPDAKLFIEDPLRLFRVMQFIGRFQMNPDKQLNEICAKMSLAGISTERIEAEFDKLFLKSKRPSLGIRWLQEIGRLQRNFARTCCNDWSETRTMLGILKEMFLNIPCKQLMRLQHYHMHNDHEKLVRFMQCYAMIWVK